MSELEQISQHVAFKEALQSLTNSMLPCVQITYTRKGYWRVVSDGEEVWILPPDSYKATCQKANQTTLRWNPPTNRVDPTESLNPDEIDHYELGYNGQVLQLNNVTTYELEFPPGTYTLKLRTIDTDGQKSEWSETVEVNL